jgi:hypothetical protein
MQHMFLRPALADSLPRDTRNYFTAVDSDKEVGTHYFRTSGGVAAASGAAGSSATARMGANDLVLV